MRKISNIIWGTVLVLLGIIFALKTYKVIDFDIFFEGWWTLFIIIPAVFGLFAEREKTGNIICLGIGVFLLLCCRDILDFSMVWKLLVPVVIVVIGLKFLISSLLGTKTKKIIKDIEKEGKNPRIVREFFSSKELEVDAEIFEGAKLVVTFGEIDYDLTKAIIEKDSGIYASAIFGRINIKVPEGVNVQVESNSILGGFSNRTNNSPDAPTIYVNGTCLFGDVEISCE